MLKLFNKTIFKSYLLINFPIFRNFLKIFPFISIIISGLHFSILLKTVYILIYLKILKFNSSFLFSFLIDMVVIDYPWKKNRFYINYILRSLKYNRVLSLYVKTSTYKPIFSISYLYNSSSWVERENWDFFGIFFLFHNNLKRLFTDYGFKGNPLRKDFPLTGFIEISFSLVTDRLFYSNITV